jgi:phage major head subunit gpT-like protein
MSTRAQRRKRKLLREIQAATATAGAIPFATAAIEIQAAGENKPATFRVVAYNGGPLKVKAYPLPIVVDLAGMEKAPTVTANLDHDQTQRVGHVTEVQNDGSQLVLEGTVSGTSSAAQEVLANASNGYPWQASIEAMPTADVEAVQQGAAVDVNGQTFTGPLLVARQSKLYGFAFLSRGADETTTVSIAAVADTQLERARTMDPKLHAWITARGFDPDSLTDAQVEFFTKQHAAEVAAAQSVGTSTSSPEQQSLDELLANEKANRARIQKIHAITASAIQDYPQSIDTIEAMARLAIESEWTVDRFELELLRAARPNVGIINRRGQARPSQQVIEAAICITGGLTTLENKFDDQTLQAAHDKFKHGISLKELFVMAARDNGYQDSLGGQVTLEVQRAAFGMRGQREIQASGFSTLNLSGILGNTANKFLEEGWMAVDQAWRSISSRASVRDFKTATTYSLTGDLQFEEMGATSEFTHGTAGSTSYTNKADTYGRMFAITRQDLINDDLGALSAVPRRIGRGAGLKLNNVFWTVFLNNSTHFASGNSNVSTGAGSALTTSGTAINAAEVIWWAQTDPDGEPLGIMPSIILVPPTLKNTAQRIMNSSDMAGSTTADALQASGNIYQGRYTVVTSPYMENTNYTGYSTAAWYLLANPAILSTIEVAFLNGRDMPTVETADADFNVLGVQMRGYSDFGVSLHEPRAGVRSAGS